MDVLNGVSDTLFIPLVARIEISRKFPEYFYDEKSISLEKIIPGSEIKEKSGEYSLVASAARYYNVDRMVKEFISRRGKCNIVNIGAGLDTIFWRINDENATFYEVDLPDVIDSRRTVLGEHEGEVLIGCDMFDPEWMKRIDAGLPTLIIAPGVLMYFKEEKVIGFIEGIKGAFPDSELIFDAINKTGVKYAESYVKKTGNTDAMMYFYVDSSEEFASKTSTRLVEERRMFTDARKILGKKVGLYTKIAMGVVDRTGRAKIIHLDLGGKSGAT